MMKKYNRFDDFYIYYLTEHKNMISRRLHVIGSSLVILLFFLTLFLKSWWLFIALPICGYGFAWVGHFFFEKNKPATLEYPVWSLMSDFVMLKDVLTGKIRW